MGGRCRLWTVRLALASCLIGTSCDRPSTTPIGPTTPTVTADTASKSGAPQAATLDEKKQEYIWTIEHTTFELETRFGKALLAAMRKRDASEVTKLLRPGCTGEVPADRVRELLDRSYFRESRLPADAGRAPVEAAGLAEYLCRYFDGFSRVELAKCRVLALDAQDQNPQSGRWTAKLLVSGSGQDASGGRLEFSSLHRAEFQFRSDEEIASGQIVDRWSVSTETTRSSPGPLFEEITQATGLDQVDIPDNWKLPVESVRQYHTQVAVADFNGDGFLDIATATYNGRWRLLSAVEEGRRYVEVTSDVQLPVWADEEPRSRGVRDQVYLATWFDFDNDGDPDLILGDRLFRNESGKSFADVTAQSGLTFDYNPRGCIVADYDGDGWLDLYVLYQQRRGYTEGKGGWVGDDASGAENQLWRNTGGGRFVNVTEAANAGGGRRQTFAAVWWHANDDHLPDLYIANDFGTNVLLINQPDGRFVDVSRSTGTADFATSMGVVAGDLTGDGESDIYVANMFSKMGRRIIAHVGPEDYPPGVYAQIQGSCAGNTLYTREASTGAYREISVEADVNEVGWAYAPALADFDSDGLLDIYATAGFLSFQRSKPDG